MVVRFSPVGLITKVFLWDDSPAGLIITLVLLAGDMLPAKILPDKNVAYVAYGGEEIAKTVYEVLRTGTFLWEFAANGTVPEGAIEAGVAADGEKLYIARAMYGGAQTPGKLQNSHGCLYIPFGGAEVCVTEYEVLVCK